MSKPLTLSRQQQPNNLTYRSIVRTLRKLDLHTGSRVIVHTSTEALSRVGRAAHTIIGALIAETGTLLMPGFTYQTMVYPKVGPPENGLDYAQDYDNSRAEFWRSDLPVHPEIGRVAEIFRSIVTGTQVSYHPILRFLGYGGQARQALDTQTIKNPLGPIRWLADHGGEAILLGTGHQHNLSLQLAEQMAGQNTYVRWALTTKGVVTVPNWPEPSSNIEIITPHLEPITRQQQIGGITIQIIPIAPMLEIAQRLIIENTDILPD